MVCFLVSSLTRQVSRWTSPFVRFVFFPPVFFSAAVIWERHQRHITGLYIHRHVRSKPIKLCKVSIATASSMWKLCGDWEGVSGGGPDTVSSHSTPKHFTCPPSPSSPCFLPIQYKGSTSIYVSFTSLSLSLSCSCADDALPSFPWKLLPGNDAVG